MKKSFISVVFILLMVSSPCPFARGGGGMGGGMHGGGMGQGMGQGMNQRQGGAGNMDQQRIRQHTPGQNQQGTMQSRQDRAMEQERNRIRLPSTGAGSAR